MQSKHQENKHYSSPVKKDAKFLLPEFDGGDCELLFVQLKNYLKRPITKCEGIRY